MKTIWYRSKVDWWLGLILIVVPLVSLAVLVASFRSSDRVELVVAIMTCIFIAALYGLLIIPVRYGIAEDELIIRFGVVRWRVRLRAIEEVKPTRNPLSSPALSLDRLAVRTGPGLLSMTLISPADREDFLKLLAMRSGLGWDGNRLVRVVGQDKGLDKSL